MNDPVFNDHNKDEFPPAHTAEHLLNQTMVRMFGCERSSNAHVERKKSKISYVLERKPDRKQEKEIERMMNQLIEDDLPVTFEMVDKDHLPDDVDASRLPEDASQTIRLVRIGDYDVCACLGTHVKSTGEIGTFRITSTSYNDGSFRFVFKVAE